MMRSNITFYVHLVNHFAPGIVSSRRWNKFKATKHRIAIGEDTLDEFFTVSDEAFMVLVLLNYYDRWTAEFELSKSVKVSPLWDRFVPLCDCLLTYCNNVQSNESDAGSLISELPVSFSVIFIKFPSWQL